MYSPFNAMLIHTQMPGARFVATPKRWGQHYKRTIHPGARPITILQPKGPVLFVFDVSDTTPLPDALQMCIRDRSKAQQRAAAWFAANTPKP